MSHNYDSLIIFILMSRFELHKTHDQSRTDRSSISDNDTDSSK